MTNEEVIYPSEGDFNITAELPSRERFHMGKVSNQILAGLPLER